MPYDEDVAHRLRELLAEQDGISERRMFGGLAFLQHGNMVIAASRNGGLLVRVDPADAPTALARPHASPMEMGAGRRPEGWVSVAPEGARTKRQVEAWLKRALRYAATLPPK